MSFTALQVPPLVRNPDTREIGINLDPCVFQVIHEASAMIKLHLDVPQTAKILLYSQHRIKSFHSQLAGLLQQNQAIREKVPMLSSTLFSTSLKKVGVLEAFFCCYVMAVMFNYGQSITARHGLMIVVIVIILLVT